MSVATFEIIFLPDERVSKQVDRQIRDLLSRCFVQDAAHFQKQRHFLEIPQYRWLVYVAEQLVAHVALHRKRFASPEHEFEIGGVAEVCVHPGFRGQGLVKRMLSHVHDWLAEQDVPFSVLFGENAVYASSGYQSIKNPIRFYDAKQSCWKVELDDHGMFKEIGRQSWPEGIIDLQGPKF